MPSAKCHKCSVVVTDGICIGHPCCSQHNCQVPLRNGKDRFCPIHVSFNEICAIVDCKKKIVDGLLTCDDPEHQKIEQLHWDKGQSHFQLHNRLQRACTAHSTAPASNPRFLSHLTTVDNDDKQFIVHPSGHIITDSAQEVSKDTSATTSRKVGAKFTRSRTHNEQLVVAPCGMILGWDTMFGQVQATKHAHKSQTLDMLVLEIPSDEEGLTGDSDSNNSLSITQKRQRHNWERSASISIEDEPKDTGSVISLDDDGSLTLSPSPPKINPVHLIPGVIGTAKFPSSFYAIDLHRVFNFKPTRRLTLEAHFEQVFQLPWKSSTYYDHKGKWFSAPHDARDKAVAAGYTEAGEYHKLLAQLRVPRSKQQSGRCN
ncbi:hypothetical protein JVU11DRAFT_9309 [Chiua virens]|nr:hypothetical protein JVU11DRAFT_9309 [Chiua virens]